MRILGNNPQARWTSRGHLPVDEAVHPACWTFHEGGETRRPGLAGSRRDLTRLMHETAKDMQEK
jgi:hypothetical protein